MRSSLMPSGNKLQNILPANAPSVRRSEDVSSVSETPDMEGWLYKQGDKYKTWNKRWFVLKANNLFYFKSPKVRLLISQCDGRCVFTQVWWYCRLCA